MRNPGIIITGIISVLLFSCKTEEIILHGDITGIVTDAETNQPIPIASVKLNDTNDTTTTGGDGSFLLKNIIPDKYEIQSSKTGYDLSKKNVTVAAAVTEQIDFPLKGIPVPVFSSTCLDFGLDSTTLSFNISNSGKGKFSYSITESQSWITVSPSTGEVANEPENIKVSINKAGLSENIYNGIIEVTSTGPGVLKRDTIHVNINGVADQECNYYKVIKIGTQTWMAENLNIGRTINIHQAQANNGYIEKWCNDCKIYGGLYQWDEAMNYNPPDSGDIGKKQGICPVGWHIPTEKEVIALSDYLGGDLYSGAKLKATGTSLWQSPNIATNESGFTALPGGSADIDLANPTNPEYNSLGSIGIGARFWTSNLIELYRYGELGLGNDRPLLYHLAAPPNSGSSVRCLKNPAK